MRTGKPLPARLTVVAMEFRRPPQLPLFPGTAEGFPGTAEGLEPDALIVRVQPDEGLSLRFGAKVPGHAFRVQKASMDFSYESFEEQSPDAYERVILDALIGDPTLFIRADDVGRSWRIVDPVIVLGRRPAADPPVPSRHLGSPGGRPAHCSGRPELAPLKLIVTGAPAGSRRRRRPRPGWLDLIVLTVIGANLGRSPAPPIRAHEAAIRQSRSCLYGATILESYQSR